MNCAWPGCPYPATNRPAPGLVNVPDNPDGPDEPVFLCAMHLAAYGDAAAYEAAARRAPEMRNFLLGLNEAAEIDPPTEMRRPALADSVPREPSIPPPPRDHGGFRGRHGDLFDHAFRVSYDLTYRAVMADPPGSGPVLYSAKRAVPIDAIGAADGDSGEHMAAVEAGCLAGQLAAFSTTGFRPPPDWPQPENGRTTG